MMLHDLKESDFPLVKVNICKPRRTKEGKLPVRELIRFAVQVCHPDCVYYNRLVGLHSWVTIGGGKPLTTKQKSDFNRLLSYVCRDFKLETGVDIIKEYGL